MAKLTSKQIVDRINARKPDDLLGFEWFEYIEYLPFADAKQFLKEDYDGKDWKKKPLSRAAIEAEMLGYMPFAWDKANCCRGISANRSVMHYIAWTWLAGDIEFSDQIDREYSHNYCFYGKPILEMICAHYGWDPKQWDDGIRTNQ